MPPMPTTERTRADDVDVPGPGVRHVADEPDARQHDRDDHDLERKPTRHDR